MSTYTYTKLVTDKLASHELKLLIVELFLITLRLKYTHATTHTHTQFSTAESNV